MCKKSIPNVKLCVALLCLLYLYHIIHTFLAAESSSIGFIKVTGPVKMINAFTHSVRTVVICILYQHDLTHLR